MTKEHTEINKQAYHKLYDSVMGVIACEVNVNSTVYNNESVKRDIIHKLQKAEDYIWEVMDLILYNTPIKP